MDGMKMAISGCNLDVSNIDVGQPDRGPGGSALPSPLWMSSVVSTGLRRVRPVCGDACPVAYVLPLGFLLSVV